MLASPRQGVEHCSPAKNHKATFLFSRFSLTKSAAKVSKEDSRRPPCNHRGVHESVARAMRGECVRQRGRERTSSLASLRNLSHTTRANISHEIAEQIRARIVCTPAESAGIDRVCFANRSIPHWRRLANEAIINNLYQNKITLCCHHAVKAETAEKFQPLVYSSAEIDGRMRIGADSDE